MIILSRLFDKYCPCLTHKMLREKKVYNELDIEFKKVEVKYEKSPEGFVGW